ncbi:NAD-binding Rossmann fold oxidoreductase [Flagelloscypha sp. PMI_526]|nr:NAD-binding Rossmann fold oxidoreductase [Flagelloscypha sp. PMI_526]
MSSQSPIRVGFIGLSSTGWSATAHAPSILKTGKYQITAVSTTSSESASRSSLVQKNAQDGTVEVNAYHGDVSQIWNDSKVDLVGIAIKASGHCEALQPVLQYKKDVFVEWPVGVTLEETREMLNWAKQASVRSVVGLEGKYSPVFQKVKHLLSTNEIGRIVSTTMLHNLPLENYSRGPIVKERNERAMLLGQGSTLLDVPCGHSLSIFCDVLGYFSSLHANAAIMYPTYQLVNEDLEPVGPPKQANCYDHIAVNGTLSSGILASLVWNAGEKNVKGRKSFEWVIEGEEGSIRMESQLAAGAFISAIDPELYLNGENIDVEGTGGFVVNYQGLWNDFANRDGQYPTLEDAFKIKQILNAIETSARERREINVTEWANCLA